MNDEFQAGISSGKKMNLAYTLLRSRKRRKTVSLQLNADGRIVIRAPLFTPKWEIDDFFRSKETWLKKRLQERKEKIEQGPGNTRLFQDGELFPFLGNWYPLQIAAEEERSPQNPLFDFRRFLLRPEEVPQGRHMFLAWYREQAETTLGKRVSDLSSRLGLSARSFRISEAKSFWGCCSAKNRVSLNWRLIMAPWPVIDYVIVHELQHIVEKNHSADFWKRVAEVIPDYKQHKVWLRRNGPSLTL